MKKCIFKCLDIVAFLLSFVITPKIINGIKYFKNKVMWEGVKRAIGKIGENSRCAFPIILHGGGHMCIGENFYIGSNCRLQAWDNYENKNYNPKLIIGNDVTINMNVDISCINEIIIGNGVQIANNVLIVDHYHGKTDTLEAIRPAKRELYSKGAVILGDNVWIGYGCAIMPDVTIGKNCIIGANSVITKNIPENSIAVGNPAQVIRTLL